MGMTEKRVEFQCFSTAEKQTGRSKGDDGAFQEQKIRIPLARKTKTKYENVVLFEDIVLLQHYFNPECFSQEQNISNVALGSADQLTNTKLYFEGMQE